MSETKKDIAPSGAEGWRYVLQLLKKQSIKMEKLGRVLRDIQEGIINSSPRTVKSSVGEANDVFSSLLNTHKSLVEGSMEIQKRLHSHPAFRKAV